jgi:hypothetical protein
MQIIGSFIRRRLMAEETKELVSRFIRKMNRTKVPENIHINRETFLEILLSNDVESINKNLFFTLFDSVRSHRTLSLIKNNSLYVIFYPKNSNRIEYMLGTDILFPEIKIPTFNHFHEIYNWYQKIKTTECKFYTSVDDLVRAYVIHSLDLIYSLQEILNQQVSLWEYVFSSYEEELL